MARKSSTRLYIPGDMPVHGVLDVPADQAHHVAHVLRLAAGDPLTIFDGAGLEYAAVIQRVTKSGVTVTIGDPQLVDRESPLAITLAQGISSGERMDYTIQKAVELGVHAVQPISAERSVVRLSAERAARRVHHWQAVAVAACEQCGRNRVPEVLPVASLGAWLATLAPDTMKLTLAPGAESTLHELERPNAAIALLVGPEGGLAPREREDAAHAGFKPLRLGPRTLRTETAALAAMAAMQAVWGDF